MHRHHIVIAAVMRWWQCNGGLGGSVSVYGASGDWIALTHGAVMVHVTWMHVIRGRTMLAHVIHACPHAYSQGSPQQVSTGPTPRLADRRCVWPFYGRCASTRFRHSPLCQCRELNRHLRSPFIFTSIIFTIGTSLYVTWQTRQQAVGTFTHQEPRAISRTTSAGA